MARVDDDLFDELERLVAELTAVEHWDVDYWRTPHRAKYEILAFAARRERRSQILFRIFTISLRLENDAKVVGTCNGH